MDHARTVPSRHAPQVTQTVKNHYMKGDATPRCRVPVLDAPGVTRAAHPPAAHGVETFRPLAGPMAMTTALLGLDALTPGVAFPTSTFLTTPGARAGSQRSQEATHSCC